MNRETWLNQLAEKMAPRFAELGKPLPEFRVSIGFTGGGKAANANGEAWHARTSADGKYSIFITPDQSEPLQVAAILAHELCHTAAGFQHKHKGDFATLMKSLGMVGKMTCSQPGPDFEAFVSPFLDELGPMPHAPLLFRPGQRPMRPANDDAEGEGEEGGGEEGDDSSNQKKKQTARLVKACCSECGYTVRVTRKWLEVGPPHCPQHGAMDTDA